MTKNREEFFFKTCKYSFSLFENKNRIVYAIVVFLRIGFEITRVWGIIALGNVIEYCANSEINIVKALSVSGSYLFLLFIAAFLNILYKYLMFICKEKLEFEYENMILNRINNLPLGFIDSSEGKNTIYEVKDAKSFLTTLPFDIIDILSFFYSFIVAVSYMYSATAFFTIVYIVFTIPGLLINAFWGRKIERFRHEKAPDIRKFCYYRWVLTDPWPAKDIRVFNLTNPLKKRYDEEKEVFCKESKMLSLKKLKFACLAEIIMRIGEITFIAFEVGEAYRGLLSIGDMTVSIGFAASLFLSVRGIVAKILLVRIAALEKLKYVDALQNEAYEKVQGMREIEEFCDLSFENVSFKYPFSDEYTLLDISFSIKKGDLLSIIGLNGAGKSTIVKLMLGLYKPTKGVIKLNGYPLEEYHQDEVRNLFSVLFQNYGKYSLSIRENVALFDMKRRDEDKSILEALQKGMIKEYFFERGGNLDSELTRQFDDLGFELSGGQWQRLALARMWFKKAKVMILDEPSASLDAEAEDFIFSAFQESIKNYTGIMISHRISSAQLSSNIIVINDGKIIEEGTHLDLMARNGLYAQMFNLQKKKYTEGIENG